MRRGLSAILSACSLLGVTSAVLGQSPYPYPYGPAPAYGQMPMPMPMPYPQQYSYPPQMPMPYPPPNAPVMRPMYYPAMNPAMMRPMPVQMQMQAAPVNQPRVYNFGPLTDGPTTQVGPLDDDTVSSPMQALPTNHGKQVLPALPSEEMLPEACGPDGCPTGMPPMRALPAPGRGHFITTLGAWLLVPYPGNNTAFTSSTGGTTTSTQFGQEMQYGPRASFGYVFHNCWGIRGNYSYLVGDVNQSISNSDPTTTITTAVNSPFGITSPSAALKAGLAPDQFNFRQKFEFHVADVELLREARYMDTTFLFSAGARYARFEQTYMANRTNPGGTTPATTVALSQEDLNTASLFSGWGPTVSFDVSQPILPCGISVYGNARGSYLFGTDRFSQNYNAQTRTVTAGVPSFTNTSQSSVLYDNRAASIIEAEAGLQCGVRLGRCYVFGRAGAAYQHWFDVGTPSTSQGSLSFVGGTATLGVTY